MSSCPKIVSDVQDPDVFFNVKKMGTKASKSQTYANKMSIKIEYRKKFSGSVPVKSDVTEPV